jgi:CRP-like cAMP-binding protein
MREVMNALSPIDDTAWLKIKECCKVITRSKGEHLYPFCKVPSSYCFMHKGIARLYACDDMGQEYNKRFFSDGQFPGIMSALHLRESVEQGIECLTDSKLVEIDFKSYRSVLFENTQLMTYQIKYLEKNWLLDKDQREILLVQQDATARYLLFLKQFPYLAKAIPQYHLASHLGISATQLSRIRKTLDLVKN